MSILIKGMEMPKGRPVCVVIDAAGQARRYDLNNDRYADDNLFEAVSVPPHGRLIDADALWEKMHHLSNNEGAHKDSAVDDSLILRDSACYLIEESPTIIPAEEGET